MLKKIGLSAGLILASAGYAATQHGAPQAVADAEIAPPVRVAAAGPAQEPLPAQAPPEIVIDAAGPARTAPQREARSNEPAPEDQPRDAPVAAPEIAAPADAPAPVQSEPAPTVVASAPPPAPVNTGRYANGDYTGASADTAWGTVQVRILVRNGAVAEVQPLDYPNHRRRSIQINEWALPALQQEAIQAQTARIDMVTQATVTSEGYQQSLASALAQAKR